MDKTKQTYCDDIDNIVKQCSDKTEHLTIVFGGGLAGLSAADKLTKSGNNSIVFEADAEVGGLSKTIKWGEYLFDIGGHRFFTNDDNLDAYVRDILGDELVEVSRTSKIYMNEKFFDYPLRPSSAVLGLGFFTSTKILLDYILEKFKRLFIKRNIVSLEDWVVSNFGRKLFEIYFKEYSEKVWGLPCSRISRGWVEKRISGLSLTVAIKNALFKFSGKNVPTLVDGFIYPQKGIGRLSERLENRINSRGRVCKNASVVRTRHEGDRVLSIDIKADNGTQTYEAEDFISTVPITALIKSLHPEPPKHVLEAADSLGYRDLLLVVVAVNKEFLTDLSWIYIPEKSIPFGRIHEPKVWSSAMAPEGKTLVVLEYFAFKGDDIWETPDEELHKISVDGLEHLGFLSLSDVIDSKVLRIEKAYPLFEVGYEDRLNVIYEYLDKFENLHIAGRSGTFQYQNMDHAIKSGMEAAASVLSAHSKAN